MTKKISCLTEFRCYAFRRGADTADGQVPEKKDETAAETGKSQETGDKDRDDRNAETPQASSGNVRRFRASKGGRIGRIAPKSGVTDFGGLFWPRGTAKRTL